MKPIQKSDLSYDAFTALEKPNPPSYEEKFDKLYSNIVDLLNKSALARTKPGIASVVSVMSDKRQTMKLWHPVCEKVKQDFETNGFIITHDCPSEEFENKYDNPYFPISFVLMDN